VPICGDLADSGQFFNTIFVSSVSIAIAVNIGISMLPLLSGLAERKAAACTDEDALDESNDIKWGAMSVISLIPLLNWLVQSINST
jgi:hypothetical protein